MVGIELLLVPLSNQDWVAEVIIIDTKQPIIKMEKNEKIFVLVVTVN